MCFPPFTLSLASLEKPLVTMLGNRGSYGKSHVERIYGLLAATSTVIYNQYFSIMIDVFPFTIRHASGCR